MPPATGGQQPDERGERGVRVRRVGDHALLVEVDSTDEVAALHAELLRRRAAGALPPLDNIVPAARTVLLDGLTDPKQLADDIAHLAVAAGARRRGAPGRAAGPLRRPRPGRGSGAVAGPGGRGRAHPQWIRVPGRLLRIRTRLRLSHWASRATARAPPRHTPHLGSGWLSRARRRFHRRLPAHLPRRLAAHRPHRRGVVGPATGTRRPPPPWRTECVSSRRKDERASRWCGRGR